MKEESLLWKVLDYCAEDQNRGVVCLIGPTGAGKTHQVNAWATARNRPVIPGDISVTDEVELGGYPIKSKDGREVYYSLPPFLVTQMKARSINTDNFVVFLDEMDKPRFQQLVCLLSLLDPKQRRLRQYTLPKTATIVCAMNEPLTALPETIISRLLFVPWPLPDNSYFNDVPSHLVALIKDTAPMPEIKLPAKAKSPRNSFQLDYWLKLTEFWENKPLQETVVRGLYPFESVPRVLKYLEGQQPVVDPARWIEKAQPSAIVENLIQVLNKATQEQKEAIFSVLSARSEADATGEIARIWEAFVTTPAASNAIGKTDAKVISEGVEALKAVVQAMKADVKRKAKKEKE